MNLAILCANSSASVGYVQSFTVATIIQRFSQRLRRAIQTKQQGSNSTILIVIPKVTHFLSD